MEEGELKKFENQYSGPYEVREILGKGNIKISVKNKPKIVNISRLRLSYITPPENNHQKKKKLNQNYFRTRWKLYIVNSLIHYVT